jgi:hypothetical protein
LTARILSPADLHTRLIAAGHRLDEGKRADCSTVVRPTPEAIITIASNLDPTLMPAYRGGYFVCLMRSETDRTPVLRDDPAFALPEAFLRIDGERAYRSVFLDGPFRWLLPRLISSGEILVWPEAGFGIFAWPGKSDDSPCLGRRLPPELDAIGAVVLDLHQDSDREALWEVAASVADGFDNYFVSDASCVEVARLHHHDKIELSIPYGARRMAALDELGRWPDLLENCAGYSTDWDDEEEP